MTKRDKIWKFRFRQRQIEQHGFFCRRPCPVCGAPQTFHYDRYDAACCLACNIWLKKNCGDPRCPYCANRPASPQLALYMEKPRSADALLRKTWRRKNFDHQERGRARRAKRRFIIDNKEDV